MPRLGAAPGIFRRQRPSRPRLCRQRASALGLQAPRAIRGARGAVDGRGRAAPERPRDRGGRRNALPRARRHARACQGAARRPKQSSRRAGGGAGNAINRAATPHLGAAPLPPRAHVLPSPPLVTLALPYRNPISHTPRERACRSHPDKGRCARGGLACASRSLPRAQRGGARDSRRGNLPGGAGWVWGRPRHPRRLPRPLARPSPSGHTYHSRHLQTPPPPVPCHRTQDADLGPAALSLSSDTTGRKTSAQGQQSSRAGSSPQLIYWLFIWRNAIALGFRGKGRLAADFNLGLGPQRFVLPKRFLRCRAGPGPGRLGRNAARPPGHSQALWDSFAPGRKPWVPTEPAAWKCWEEAQAPGGRERASAKPGYRSAPGARSRVAGTKRSSGEPPDPGGHVHTLSPKQSRVSGGQPRSHHRECSPPAINSAGDSKMSSSQMPPIFFFCAFPMPTHHEDPHQAVTSA